MCLGGYRRAGSGSARQRCAFASFSESRECSRERTLARSEKMQRREKRRGRRRETEAEGVRFSSLREGNTRMTRRWELFPAAEMNPHIASAGLVLTPRHAMPRRAPTECTGEVHRPLRSLRYPRPTVIARRGRGRGKRFSLPPPSEVGNIHLGRWENAISWPRCARTNYDRRIISRSREVWLQ